MRGSHRRSSRNKLHRKKIARESVDFLTNVLSENISTNSRVADSAARQLIGIGRRHGIRPETNTRKMVCRNCRKSLSPGSTARFRLSSGKLIVTCLRCERPQRFKI